MKTKINENVIPETLLGCMDMIVAKGGEKALKIADVLARRLQLTSNQTILLSYFLSKADDNRVYLSEIAELMGCTLLSVLKSSSDIDVLVNKHYLVRSTYNGSTTYAVNNEALKALCKDRPYIYVPTKPKNLSDFVDKICELIFELRNRNLALYDFTKEFENLLENCRSLREVKYLTRIKNIMTTDLAVFFFIVNSLITDNDEDVSTEELSCLFDCRSAARNNTSSMLDGSNLLIVAGLVEGHCDDGFSSQKYFCLTEKAKHLLFPGLSFSNTTAQLNNLIRAENIVAKKLFYNAEVRKQVEELKKMLMPRNYKLMVKRLEDVGLRKGIACLLYGEPGTGKTELVFQLAKATGRDIFKVDASTLRDKYVGESEKHVKAFFEEYRKACSKSKHTPVLFFNEADGILGTRFKSTNNSVDQMSNTINNLLLEEIENLQGILIATTNLPSNLDAAFTRRFLYKINLKKPDVQVRAAILKSKLKFLTKIEAEKLATLYPLSGGEVENISRKAVVRYVVSGSRVTFDELSALCKAEVSKLNHVVTIGFNK